VWIVKNPSGLYGAEALPEDWAFLRNRGVLGVKRWRWTVKPSKIALASKELKIEKKNVQDASEAIEISGPTAPISELEYEHE
jgi:hypothetical protein